ncbi:outer membrane protein assembly factor BamD [Candidatus Pelagibacter sp.]|nr:outer membrane protein assembly factor BamD [Candidatus Pelagibacter sp.]
MIKFYILFFSLIFFFTLNSCSKKDNITKLANDNIEVEMINAYKQGLIALEEGDSIFAAKKFNEAELLYPQSEWAPRSALMASYSFYKQSYYGDAIYELERFLKNYPNAKQIDYANFLLAMCYYEQIVDEKKDLNPLLKSRAIFLYVVENYPTTDYAMDAEFKLDLIEETLASKEMYIAMHYIKKDKWIAAINRYKSIISKYSSTIYVEEAIHRLVELHYRIGLENEAKKYAKLLGYNYQSSIWYEKSYILFNSDYTVSTKKILEDNKKKNLLLKKVKSIFN